MTTVSALALKGAHVFEDGATVGWTGRNVVCSCPIGRMSHRPCRHAGEVLVNRRDNLAGIHHAHAERDPWVIPVASPKVLAAALGRSVTRTTTPNVSLLVKVKPIDSRHPELGVLVFGGGGAIAAGKMTPQRSDPLLAGGAVDQALLEGRSFGAFPLHVARFDLLDEFIEYGQYRPVLANLACRRCGVTALKQLAPNASKRQELAVLIFFASDGLCLACAENEDLVPMPPTR